MFIIHNFFNSLTLKIIIKTLDYPIYTLHYKCKHKHNFYYKTLTNIQIYIHTNKKTKVTFTALI